MNTKRERNKKESDRMYQYRRLNKIMINWVIDQLIEYASVGDYVSTGRLVDMIRTGKY